MRVLSGAGEFELTIDRVYKRGRDLIMVGKMGVWESETIVTPEEFADIMRVSASPSIMALILKLPFMWLGQALKGGRKT